MDLFVVAFRLHVMTEAGLAVFTNVIVLGMFITVLTQVSFIRGLKVASRFLTFPALTIVDFYVCN